MNSNAVWPSRPKGTSLCGIVTPMVTPLAGKDKLDAAGLERLIEHILGGGVAGVFILGTTGEGPSLSHRLRCELIDRTCRQVASRVPVLVGITDPSLTEAANLATYAADAGAQAVVVSSPYYFPVGQTELLSFIRPLVRTLSLPLYLYNMPILTKTCFAVETVRKLAQLEGIVGLKDSSGELDYFRQVVEIAKERPDWRLFVGPEHLLVEAVMAGAHGGFNGGSQIEPALFVELYKTVCRGEHSRAMVLQQRLLQLGQIYRLDRNGPPGAIRGIKCALALLGICKEKMAAPLSPCGPKLRKQVRKVLEAMSLLPSLVKSDESTSPCII